MSVPCCHRCSAPESGNKQKNKRTTDRRFFLEFLTQSVRSTWKRWKNGITRERERRRPLHMRCGAAQTPKRDGEKNRFTHTQEKLQEEESLCAAV